MEDMSLEFSYDWYAWNSNPSNPYWWWGAYVDNVKMQVGRQCSFITLNANAGEPGPGDGASQFQNNAGDGINIATGNVYLPQTDFTTTRDGIPPELNLQFNRIYNSQINYNGHLGYGWTYNYNMEIIPMGGNAVGLRRERGQVLYFEDHGGEWFVGQKGVKNKLKQDAQNQYIFTTVNHITYTFDPEGKLLEIEDLHENKLSMHYEDGKLVSVTDDFGKEISIVYSGNLIISVTDPAGTSYFYDYDSHDNLVAKYFVEGELLMRQYLYEDPFDSHNLTGIIDENGDNYNTFIYDTLDQAIVSRKAADINQIFVDYAGDFTVTVTNSFSQALEYTREIKDGMGYITSISKAQDSGGMCSTCAPIGSYEYSDVHTIEGITDARGYESSFSYDNWGNILSRTEAVGEENERTITNTYDMFMLPDGIPVNQVETITIDSIDTPGQNRMTRLWYDYGDGNLYQMTESGYMDGVLNTRTTTVEHNDRGQITRVDGPRSDVNDVTEFIYYPNEESYGNKRGRLHKSITPAGITEYLDYNAFGQPLHVKDANNIESTYTYYLRGQLKTSTTADSTYTYTYNKVGNFTQMEDPEGRITIYRYDEAHRLYEIEDPFGNRTVYTLDTEGNRTKEEVFDSQDVLVKTVSMEYDNQNRLKRIIYPDAAQQQYSYDPNGNVTSTTNEEGAITEYEYDELNRLVKQIQLMNGEEITTGYTYDSHDNLRGVVDANGHTTTYDYDDFKEVLSASSPDTGMSIFAYDGAGNLKQKTDSKGITVFYIYDAVNRLTNIDYPDDSDIIYTYDNEAVSCGIGRLTGMNDATGSYTYHYDTLGRFKKEEKTISGIPYTTEYGYDDTGVMTDIKYPGGRQVSYGLDSAGRIKSVAANGQLMSDNVTHMPFGPIKEWYFGNGIKMEGSYNNRYRITEIKAGDLLNFGYSYYNDGKIKKITGDSSPSLYDFSEGYEYVQGTNRLLRMTGYNMMEFAHDENGNISAAGGWGLIYNQNQRLIEVTENGSTIGKYTYNGRGQRIIKEAGGATTVYHYDLSGNLIAEGAATGAISAEYIYMEGYRLAKINSATDDAYYYLSDHIGTPRKLMDQNGDIVWSAQYTPFGGATVEAGSTVENNFRFRGQYYDSETGLHYNYHRYYSPIIGRYLRADPIGQNGGLNLYTYAANDPVNGVDPYGLKSCPLGTIHKLNSECFHNCLLNGERGMFECADECATCMEKEPASGWSTGYSRGYSSAGREAGTILSVGGPRVTPISSGKSYLMAGGLGTLVKDLYKYHKGLRRASRVTDAINKMKVEKNVAIRRGDFGKAQELDRQIKKRALETAADLLEKTPNPYKYMK